MGYPIGPETLRSHLALTQRYKVVLDRKVFVGLCAYLQTLISWGFQLQPRDLDRFFFAYHVFMVEKPNVSYHEWFMDLPPQDPRLAREDRNIMNLDLLNIVCLECPYTFKLVSERVNLVVETLHARQEQQATASSPVIFGLVCTYLLS